MKRRIQARGEDGFTLMEMLVSLAILVPLIGAVVGLFAGAATQHSTEQNSIETNMDARGALELMTTEIAQAGSHGDRGTTATGAIVASTNAQNVSVGSSSGIRVGDFVDVDTGAANEIVQVTDVQAGSISGIFRIGHAANTPIRLFALPYKEGVIPWAAIAPNSSATATRLSLLGDMNSDGTVYYVEYDYDVANAQITRSMTPITQANLNPALSLVRNVVANSVQFTLYTDDQSIVTSVNVDFTVRTTVTRAPQTQATRLSSRVLIPSAAAASVLQTELQTYGGVDRFPPTPAQVTSWAIR
jgi:Tfp pilus assembly protein PilW